MLFVKFWGFARATLIGIKHCHAFLWSWLEQFAFRLSRNYNNQGKDGFYPGIKLHIWPFLYKENQDTTYLKKRTVWHYYNIWCIFSYIHKENSKLCLLEVKAFLFPKKVYPLIIKISRGFSKMVKNVILRKLLLEHEIFFAVFFFHH